MEYYAKSANPQGYQEPLKHHLQKVSELAQEFGKPLGLDTVGALAGQMHDFGKYSQAFQDVLRGTRTGIDHAMAGACLLERLYRGRAGSRPVIEAVNGHHDGLLAYDVIRSELRAIAAKDKTAYGNGGKTPSIESGEQLTEACTAFRQDFPEFRPPKQLPAPPTAELESMLYTRMLFSCLVDADYTASALNDDGTYLAHAEDSFFDPALLLEKLYAYRDDIKRNSKSDQTLNAYRDQVFDRCGEMGDAAEGLFTLTAPTGTGKTLALLHFALRHCLKHGKRRIIIVLPFLTLAEQSADTYANIIPNILTDHSQSHLPEDARELAARWSAPVIITTSVRFFEALFSDRPTVCRKLHNIADSVVLFDEAQSLPASLTSSTLRGVNELCRRYHTTIVFSTATQPDFSARKDVDWHPTEILPEHKALFAALQRVNVAGGDAIRIHRGGDVRARERLRHRQPAPPRPEHRAGAEKALSGGDGIFPDDGPVPRPPEQADPDHPGALGAQAALPGGGHSVHRSGGGPGLSDNVPGPGSLGGHHPGCRALQPKWRGHGPRDRFPPGG